MIGRTKSTMLGSISRIICKSSSMPTVTLRFDRSVWVDAIEAPASMRLCVASIFWWLPSPLHPAPCESSANDCSMFTPSVSFGANILHSTFYSTHIRIVLVYYYFFHTKILCTFCYLSNLSPCAFSYGNKIIIHEKRFILFGLLWLQRSTVILMFTNISLIFPLFHFEIKLQFNCEYSIAVFCFFSFLFFFFRSLSLAHAIEYFTSLYMTQIWLCQIQRAV